MCMKYVNAIAECYEGMVSNSDGSVSYLNLFNRIHASFRQNGMMEVGGFVVVTRINNLGTSHEEHAKDNILMQRGTLDVIIRLTKCSTDESQQLCIDLDSFSIDLKQEESRIDHACFDFFNYTRISEIKDFDLELGAGKYVIKVLMKEHEEDASKYAIQYMTSLYIEKPKE